MAELFCLEISPGISMDEAWEQLEVAGLNIAYSEEDGNLFKLFVYADSRDVFEKYAWVNSCAQYDLPEINWEEQWKIHGLDFKDGCVHVDLSLFGGPAKVIKLQSGPGFGDLSHPTTALVLRMMSVHLENQPVIDVGSGSGVLTCAAIAMGSSKGYGIDIDPQAIEHSIQNGKLNLFDKKIQFALVEDFKIPDLKGPVLIVMNMIYAEQQIAWQSLPALHDLPGKIITSGVTKDQRAAYLQQAKEWGWHLIDEMEESDWLAFCFNVKSN